MFKLNKWSRLGVLVFTDVLLLIFSFYLSFVLRFDSFALGPHETTFWSSLPLVLTIFLTFSLISGIYNEMWRHAGLYVTAVVSTYTLLCCFLFLVGILYIPAVPKAPRSIPIILFFIFSTANLSVKFLWRLLNKINSKKGKAKSQKTCLVYGAGAAGELFIKHAVAGARFSYKILGFIDDDRLKKGRYMSGYQVIGQGKDLPEIARKHHVDKVIIALHAAPGSMVRNIIDHCHSAGLDPVMMPNIVENLEKKIPITLRDVELKDLLKRSPKSIKKEEVRQFFHKKTVLISGAGGSIGSEISKQVIEYKPNKIILVDSSEFNIYQIDQTLKSLLQEKNFETKVFPILGSVCEDLVLERAFSVHKPDIVLHAAAYKHVPLVEDNPSVGILNNLEGTKKLADYSIQYQVKNFLLISTDKAVRPTNIMGASKRCCELLMQSYQKQFEGVCSFSSVRFGNVLGSSGSVVPKFIKQIQKDEPITVTHKNVIRYFMLVEEAVQLVLQAISRSEGGEIFVLDMGKPVNIADMAKQLLRLSGKNPNEPGKIEYTGLRPGEKLFEELIIDGAEKSELHDNIWQLKPTGFDSNKICNSIEKVLQSCKAKDIKTALAVIKDLSQLQESV